MIEASDLVANASATGVTYSSRGTLENFIPHTEVVVASMGNECEGHK